MIVKSLFFSPTIVAILATMLVFSSNDLVHNETVRVVNICTTTMPIKNQNSVVLNNKTLNFEKAIENGYIVEIGSSKPSSDELHFEIKQEIYNIKNLDSFMENTKNKNIDKIRVVKYAREEGNTWVNKLYDLEYDGKKIKETVYDVYSNPNVFIASTPIYFDKIIKRNYPNDLWYGMCKSDDKEENCFTLISLKKSSIVN